MHRNVESQNITGTQAFKRLLHRLTSRVLEATLTCSGRSIGEQHSADVNFCKLMSGMRGGISLDQAGFLRHLANQVERGCVVEVGSFQGKSAIALSCGVRDLPANERPNIYCVEPHKPFTGFYGGEFGPADRRAFYENMIQTQCYLNVALINLSSEFVAPNWQEPVGLLFIDGDHRYSAVARDFSLWERHLVAGGIVAFDDAIDPRCGPYQLIEEINAQGSYFEFAREGKIIALKKLHNGSQSIEGLSHRPRRFLIACHDIVLSGGLLRMDRVGSWLKYCGHYVAYVVLSDGAQAERETDFDVLKFEEAAATSWDCVMVPGAGFPLETIEKFHAFRRPSFGVRVQHVLNDQTRREKFLRVNESLSPHIVLFNNRAWPAGSYSDFRGARFHVLEGAVDTSAFRPHPFRSHPLRAENWIIGGLVSKNPEPIIEALSLLPENTKVKLYGLNRSNIAVSHGDLIATNRLELVGPIHGADLSEFYQSVDCVCMTELFAGWSNLVAEAMASGVPVVCTSHGTTAFASDNETAIIVDPPTPELIAEAILRLRDDPNLCIKLARNARAAIEPYTWDAYAQELVRLTQFDGDWHYYCAPELQLFGKWPAAERLQGLDLVLSQCRGSSVLDLGAAEGLIARQFLRSGANYLHGFEIDPNRVARANELITSWKGSTIRVGDVGDWPSLLEANSGLIDDFYDIVLCLGVYHHLPKHQRKELLQSSLQRASRFYAIRTPLEYFESDSIENCMESENFVRIDNGPVLTEGNNLGQVRLYARED